MQPEIIDLQQKIETLSKLNADLMQHKQAYNSAQQSFNRMSMRLRKLCKRLTPSTEIVQEMQHIADDIRQLTKIAVSQPNTTDGKGDI